MLYRNFANPFMSEADKKPLGVIGLVIMRFVQHATLVTCGHSSW